MQPSQPIQLADGNCLLFAYGQLQPGRRAPRTLLRAWADQVNGLLFDLGSYPAAVKIAEADRFFAGFVLELEYHELVNELDPFEELDKGLYRRIRTVTRGGFDVWIYEYARPIPTTAIGPIDRWPRVDCAAGVSPA